MCETVMIVENRVIMINRCKMRPSQITFNMVTQLFFFQRDVEAKSYLQPQYLLNYVLQ